MDVRNFLISLLVLVCTTRAYCLEINCVKQIYQDYLTEVGTDFDNGNSIEKSSNIYFGLLDSRIDTSKARLIIILKPISRSRAARLKPNKAYIRGKMPSNLIWHSFIMFDGKIFDISFNENDHCMINYFDKLWKEDKTQLKIMSVMLKDLIEVSRTISGGMTRIFEYEMISLKQLIENPLFISEK